MHIVIKIFLVAFFFEIILIFLVYNSDEFLISDGDIKYTTFSSKDLKTKNAVSDNEIKINKIKKALNLTFLPYMKF